MASRSDAGQLGVPREVVGDRQPQRRGRELVVGEELRVVAAGRDQRVHELVAVGERPLDLHAVRGERVEQPQRARGRVEPDRHADLRVLGREAREQHRDAALGGRQRAQRARCARPAAQPASSARGRARSAARRRRRGEPSASRSLNEITPPSRRPSNSGIATWVAASSGARPESDSSHAAREAVAHTAWMTGTPRSESADASHSCQASPTPSPPSATTASPALEPPVASIVTTSASTLPSSSSSAGTRPSASRRSV